MKNDYNIFKKLITFLCIIIMINNGVINLCTDLQNQEIHGVDAFNLIAQVITNLYYYNTRKNVVKSSSDNSDVILNFVEKYKDILVIKNKNIFNTIFSHFMKTETLLMIKDYYRHFNNSVLIDWIVRLSNVSFNDNIVTTILDANVKVNSFMESVFNLGGKSKIYGVQSNPILFNINQTNIMIQTNESLKNNLFNDDILINDVSSPIKTFDVIFFDLPHDIHNVVHASCCKKIKNLKLRGTKAEPLLLQFVMMSLNKNGRAYMIVPDSLLFSESVQPVETRKYLLENFNIKKIIQIDEQFYRIKGVKNSILYFENNGKTTNIEFSKISLIENNIKEENITTINSLLIEKNLYSLYYKLYMNDDNKNNDIKYLSASELFNFNVKSDVMLSIDKYYKNNKSIEIVNKYELNDNIYISCKDNDIFMLKYLEYIIKSKYEQLVKGKMKQFDVKKISEIIIPLLPDNKKKAVCNYIDFSNKIIQNNNDQIEYYENMKDCLLSALPSNSFIDLEKVCKLVSENNNKLIGIIKNGLTAGTIYINNEELQNNSHYLKVIDNNFSCEYIYYYLKFTENKIKEHANLTSQPSINKSFLLSYKIPVLDLESQLEIVKHCQEFDDNIQKFQFNNNVIREKDIMSIVLKLNKI